MTQKQEILDPKVQEALAIRDPEIRRLKLRESIIAGQVDLEMDVHRRSRVERAKLSAQISRNMEVSEMSSTLIQEVIQKVDDKEKSEAARLLSGRLDAAEVKAVQENLQKLEQEKKDYLEAKAEVLKAEKAEITEGQKFVHQLGDVAESVTNIVVPEKIAKNMSRTEKVVFGSVLTAGVGVAAFLVLKKVFGWGKKAVEAGEEAAAKSEGGFFKKLFIGLGIGAGVLFGGKWVLDNYLEGKMKEKYEDFKKKAGEKVDEVKEGAKNVAKNAEKKAKELITGEKESPEIEQGKESIAEAASLLTSSGLVLAFSDQAEKAEIKEEVDATSIAFILNQKETKNIPMSDLAKITSKAAATEYLKKVLPPEQQSDSQAKALYFLALVSVSMKPFVQQSFEARGEKGDIDSMPLSEFFSYTQQFSGILARMTTALKGRGLSGMTSPQTVKEVFDAAFSRDNIHELFHHPALRTEFENLGIKGKEDLFMGLCFSASGAAISLNSIKVEESKPEEVQSIQKALIQIRESLAKPEAREYLKKYLHGRTDKQFSEKLETLLSQNLTVLDAVQLYGVLRIASSGKDTIPTGMNDTDIIGALLVQMKVIDLLSKQDSELGKRLSWSLLFDSATSKIDLPPGALELLKKFGTELGKTSVRLGTEFAEEAWTNISILAQEFYRSYPTQTKIAGGVLAGIGSAVGGVVIKNWFTYDWTTHMADRAEAASKGWKRWFAIGKTREQIASRSAGSEMSSKLKNIQSHIKQCSPEVQKILMKRYNTLHGSWFKSAYTEKHFRELLDELHSQHTAGAITDEVFQSITDDLSILRHEYKGALKYLRYGKVSRFLKNGGPLAAYIAYKDIVEIGEKWEEEKQMKEHTKKVYEEVESQLNTLLANGKFKKEGDVYVHTESNVRISLAEVRKALESPEDLKNSETIQQYTRAGISTAAVATLFMGAKVFTGPVGFAVLTGVQITVEAGMEAWRQGKVRSFIADCPPWLLVSLGLEGTTGDKAYDQLSYGSTWMVSDILGREVVGDDKQMRKKMLFVMFCHDLQQYAPNMFADVTQGLDTAPMLDQLYNREFSQLILPFFFAQLFQNSNDGSIPWEAIQRGDIDESTLGKIMSSPQASSVEIRSAMRQSAIMYQQHITEKRYLEAVQVQKEMKDTEKKTDPVLELLIEELKDSEVFGKKISELTPEELQANGGKTRAELLISAITQKISQSPGKTRDEKMKMSNDLLNVDTTKISGLKDAKDILKSATILSWVKDPALRAQLSQVFPEYTDDREAENKDSVFKTGRFMAPVGLNQYSLQLGANAASQGISKQAGLPEFGEDASADANMRRITEGAITILAKNRSSNGLERNKKLESELYADEAVAPVVLTKLGGMFEKSGEKQLALCRNLARPNNADPAFAMKNVRAVTFEGKTLENGHEVVLATFLYGDLNDPKKNSFSLQRAASTFALSNSVGFIQGMNFMSNGTDTLTQNNFDSILRNIVPELKEKEIEYKKEEERKQQIAKQDAERENTMKSEYEKTLETAKKQPGIWHGCPPLPNTDGKIEPRYNYVTYMPDSNMFVYMLMPEVNDAPSMSNNSAEYKKAVGNGSKTRIKLGTWDKPFAMHPNYSTIDPKLKVQVARDAMVLPIEGKEVESIRKILAVYVKNINEKKVRDMEEKILPLYGEMKNVRQRSAFLSMLERSIYLETREEESAKAEWVLHEGNIDNVIESMQKKMPILAQLS